MPDDRLTLIALVTLVTGWSWRGMPSTRSIIKIREEAEKRTKHGAKYEDTHEQNTVETQTLSLTPPSLNPKLENPRTKVKLYIQYNSIIFIQA